MVTSSSLSLRRLSSGLTGCEVHARTARRGRPANATQSARRGAAVRAQAKKDDGKDNEDAASNKNSNGATNKDGKKEGRETEYIDTLEAYYSMDNDTQPNFQSMGDGTFTPIPDLDEIEDVDSLSPTTSMDEEKMKAFESYYTDLAEEERERQQQARRQEQYFASASKGGRNVEAFFQIGLITTIASVSAYLAVSSGSAVPPPRLIELFAIILGLGFEVEKLIVSRLPKAAQQYATLLEFFVQVSGWTYILLSAAKGPLLYELVPSASTAGLSGDSIVGILPSVFVTVYAARALNRWKRRALKRAATDQLQKAESDFMENENGRSLMSRAAAANVYVVADRILTPVIWLLTIIFVLDQFGVPLKPLLTFGGVAGLAVGFAAQQVVSNLFGGVVLNTTQPFARNDLITDAKGDFEGFVDKVGWFITRLQCPAGPVFIPNSVFLTSVVTNKTSVYGRRRPGQLLAVTVSVRHSDIYLVEKCIRQIRKAINRVDEGPDGGIIDSKRPVRVYVCAVGAKSIDIGVSCGLTSSSTEDFLASRSTLLIVICKAILSTGAQLAPRFEEHEDRKTLAYPRYEDLWRWAGGSVPEVPYPSEQGAGGFGEMLQSELGERQ